MGYIYKIVNDINNKVYIGQTTLKIKERFYQHISSARNSKINTHLYYAMRKYGIEHFQIQLIEEVDDNLLPEREQYWIKRVIIPLLAERDILYMTKKKFINYGMMDWECMK